MIRTTIIHNLVRRQSFSSAAIVLCLTLPGCMTAQKEAAVVDDNQDVAAILPAVTSEQVTGTTPRDPRSPPLVRTANGDIVPAENTVALMPQQTGNQTAAMGNGNAPVQALGIMQSTRVNAGSGSIFSSLTNDQSAFDPNDPNAIAANGTAVKPIKKSLFSAMPMARITPQTVPQDVDVIVPPASASGDPTKDPNYDAGIVVMHRQSDEERRIMAEKNDLAKNAHPQIRAMEPDAQAAPANGPARVSKSQKKAWSLKDMFGDLGKNAGNRKTTSTQ